ncbi:DUF6876 family protein [Telmatospirillum sp.]|uniref:DUF6876 family protein n=1 Tax=Telmatospirillum sp. TaxID=2079197 RepID=UPI00283EF746|nr:DUF6876 family protein [Telmatospirillum sp.]MDR3436403.1 hypothetical protein [Telmatospirillum sp.]
MTPITPEDLRTQLAQHTGSEQLFFNPLYRRLNYTEGVKQFAELAGAYWFLDIVGTEIFPLQATEDFIAITLASSGHNAVIAATDGNEKVLFGKEIAFTDCPKGAWKFYLIDNVFLLPSEY